MAISDSYTDTVMANMKPFTLIATDGGYILLDNNGQVYTAGAANSDELRLDSHQCARMGFRPEFGGKLSPISQ